MHPVALTAGLPGSLREKTAVFAVLAGAVTSCGGCTGFGGYRARRKHGLAGEGARDDVFRLKGLKIPPDLRRVLAGLLTDVI